MSCTGYTAKLVEEGQSFEEFVMTCARGMGFCITMRDDSQDTPIPKSFQVNDWDLKELLKAKKELKRLTKMNLVRRIAYEKALQKTKEKEILTDWNKELKESERVCEMKNQVALWTPPEELREFKDFMLQQLSITDSSCKYYEQEYKVLLDLRPIDLYLYKEAVAHCRWEIKYHTEEHDKELKRVAERNRYLKLLRDSLKDHKKLYS